MFMTIGFAAISTSLSVTGKTTVATTIDDFKVYFSDVKVNGVQDLSLVENETVLNFDFYIEEVGTSFTIDYNVTNGLKYYDASLSMSCTNGNNYLSIVNTFDTSTNLVAKQTRSGSLVMKKIKSIAKDEVTSNRVVCTLTASPVERTTINNDEAVMPVSKYAVGREITIGEEKFNIISDNGDTVSMLAQYNIGEDNKQTELFNPVSFANDCGWEYEPGPKEIDIQVWGGDSKVVLNNYVSYLAAEYSIDITGDLITWNELRGLGCIISSNYAAEGGSYSCVDSPYRGWLINGQDWWIRSAVSDGYDTVTFFTTYGLFYSVTVVSESAPGAGVRPIITIAKTDLDNYI